MRSHEAKLAAQRRWYYKNREEVLAWQSRYYLKNRERELPKHRAYNARPEVKERARLRYQNNIDSVRVFNAAYTRTTMGRFKAGRRAATKRGISWNLSFDTYLGLIAAKQCHYCDGALSPTCTGLDRIDNARGYEVGNVLPCCGDCNRHRQNTWTVEETVAAVRAVLSLRKEIRE